MTGLLVILAEARIHARIKVPSTSIDAGLHSLTLASARAERKGGARA